MPPNKDSTDYWQDKYDKKQITTVDFKPKTSGQKPSKCWRFFKRFVDVKQGDEIPAIYALVKNFAVCPSCDKVIRYGTSPSTLVKHIQSFACKASPSVKEQFPNSKKRHSANVQISIPDKGNKKYKQSLIIPLPTIPQLTDEKKAMFRNKMLMYDLGVINKDLRPFNFINGQGMKERDQAL